MNNTRFIFITGGVISSLGKGITSATTAALLQSRGYTVRVRKLDPYFNVDAGTMSPQQHGEVYVTDDGAETDLDLGNYERFTGIEAKRNDSITSGKIYYDLLTKERRGDYLGETVQIIPHVTDLIKEFMMADLNGFDFVLYEIGGTVGDIEGLPFFETIRQMSNILGHERVLYLHLTLVPYIKAANELKTKPTQHSVKELLSLGIQPNILLCRAEQAIPEKEKEKIALFCNVKKNCVISGLDQKNIYQVLLQYHAEGIDQRILEHFKINNIPEAKIDKWHEIADKINNPKGKVRIAIVGKYNTLKDSYKSLIESLSHAGIYWQHTVEIIWVCASGFNHSDLEELSTCHGIIVPGGFGERYVEGKVSAIKYARENNIPFLGICYGMQLALIEFARNVLGIADAVSSEYSETGTKIIDKIKTEDENLGGSMRVGAKPCMLAANSLAAKVYQTLEISERHRHRYTLNMEFKQMLERAGMLFSGMSLNGNMAEIIELPSHPWFIGVQFHPEFKSKPFAPHPLFNAFIKNAIG
jgi:CTP synthase